MTSDFGSDAEYGFVLYLFTYSFNYLTKFDIHWLFQQNFLICTQLISKLLT